MSNEFLPEVAPDWTVDSRVEREPNNLEALKELRGHLVTSFALRRNADGETTSYQPHMLQVESVEDENGMTTVKAC